MTVWLLCGVQLLAFILLAPLFVSWVRRLKCYCQNRSAPPFLQPYWDLLKLFAKAPLVPQSASWLFRAAPYVVFSSTLIIPLVIPILATGLPSAAMGDMIVLVGFFALGRFFLTLAGLDAGTPFGGMGSSREATIAALAEPAMLMAVFTLAMNASTTNLSNLVQHNQSLGPVLVPSYLFALFGLMLVAVAETGRIPVDNPTTHLELTMIHEAMVLEYSGRHLALIEWASHLKLAIYAVLIANIFMPWGLAQNLDLYPLTFALAALVLKLMGLGAVLVISETLLAKMRLFQVPQFLGLAYIISAIGLLSHIILESGPK